MSIDDFNSKLITNSLGRLMSDTILPSPNLLRPMRNYEHADWMYERIVRSINDFEGNLSDDKEVGLRLANFEGVGLIYIDDVGYWNPNIIKFYGVTGDGAHAELLQHTGQLNFLLLALPKIHEKPKRIGFDLVKRIEEKGE